MAFAERADLVARLSLDARNFTSGIKGVTSSLGGFAGKIKNSSAVSTAFGVGLERVAEAGLRVVGRAITGGIKDLAQLESATTSVDAAIKQMGFTGQITAQQVAQMGQEIETAVGSAFDDKAITQAATTLLRFGKVTPQNLKPALQVMTDLATKTGSVDSAASTLARALADPEKAAGKLARAGVILTKQQQDQIKAMVAAGDAAGAQKLLLDELAKATTGAALASQGPYQRSLSELKDVEEEVQKAFAEGFLPVIERVRDFLSKKLADPAVINDIRGFGKSIAGLFDSAVDLGEKIPWDLIGGSLKTAGQGAKLLVDSFLGLPDWVKTAVLTGWGLNKLSGGAILNVGVDLVKGAAGNLFSRGASPANPLFVAPVGGGLGGGVPGAPASGGLGAAGKLFLVGEAIGLIAAVAQVRDSIASGLKDQAVGIHGAVSAQINAVKPDLSALAQSMAGVDQGIDAIQSNPLNVLVGGDALNELKNMRSELGTKLLSLNDHTQAAFRNSERADAATSDKMTARLIASDHASKDDLLGGIHSGANRTVDAIHRKRLSLKVTTNVRVNTSVTTGAIARATKISQTYNQSHVARTGGFQEFDT